jgi:predicted MFS family arabinose efflux permease
MKPGLARQIIIVTFFRLLLNTTRRFIYPFAPALSRELGVPLAAITSMIATSQFTSLIGVFSGPLADRFGYRGMMRAGLAVLSAGMLLCGLAPTYWPVFVGLVVASFGKTIFDPAIQAFIGHYVPFERRGRVIGVVETAWAGSTLLGIPALGLIIDHIGLTGSFYILALLGGLSWIALGRVIPVGESGVGQQGKKGGILLTLKQLICIRPAFGMLAFGFWISIANDCLFVVYGAWFEQDFLVSIVTLGFSTVAIGSAELLGESMTALFSDRLGLKRSLMIGLCLAICAYILLPFIGRTLPLAMAGMFFVFLFFEFAMVTSFSLSTELMPQARATMMAGFYASAGVGRMIGILAGASLWQYGGIRAVAWSAAGLTAIGLLSLIWGLHGWRRETVEVSPVHHSEVI